MNRQPSGSERSDRDTMYEVEQKYGVQDLETIAERLNELGASWEDEIEQADRYFAHPCRDFSQTDEAFRLRQIGNANFVTYKGPKIDATTKTRRELELPLTDGPAFAKEFAQLLELLDFKFVAEVHKHRRKAVVIWLGGPIEVVLDRVTGVGTYVELEVMSTADNLDAARQRLANLGTALELQDVVRQSYLELLLDDKR